MATRPANTWVSQVINPGIDKTIPLGVVNVVYDRDSGKAVGFMRGDKFYNLGTNPGTVDKEEAQAKTAEETKIAREQAKKVSDDPLGTSLNSSGLAVSTDPDNGRTLVLNGDGIEHFLYIGLPSKPDVFTRPFEASSSINANPDYDVIRNKVLEDAQRTPGGVEKLFTNMYNSGLISRETLSSKDFSSQEFNRALQFALRDYSVSVVDNWKFKGDTKPKSFLEYLNNGLSSAKPTSKTTYDSVVTTLADASEDADRFFMNYLGRSATKEERSAYYQALRAAEKKAVSSTTTKYDASGNPVSQVRSGSVLDDIDKRMILGKIAGTAIKGSDIDTLIKAGGGAAQDVNNLVAYAKKYGVNLSTKDAMGYVVDNLNSGKDLDANKAKILAVAQSTYGNLNKLINDNVSVGDLAQSFVYEKAKILEMSPDTIDVFDEDIQEALRNGGKEGTMNMNDFNIRIKSNPKTRAKWAQTKNAKEEASNYAYDILKSFGLMA